MSIEITVRGNKVHIPDIEYEDHGNTIIFTQPEVVIYLSSDGCWWLHDWGMGEDSKEEAIKEVRKEWIREQSKHIGEFLVVPEKEDSNEV